MSESLRNDGRVWVPKTKGDKRPAAQIPEEDRDYYLERIYPSFGNLVPRDVASRNAKNQCDAGFGVSATGKAVYLDFAAAIKRDGKEKIKAKYGNLFDMYQRITDQNPYETPMMIYPAIHYTMGGLWVDYNLMSTIPGCFVIGEANFSDHGANRLGASALMQGLADGYFVLPYTIADYLSADIRTGAIPTDSAEFDAAEKEIQDKVNFFINNNGTHSVDYFHKKLGHIMWNKVGMGRTPEGLKEAIKEIEEVIIISGQPSNHKNKSHFLINGKSIKDYDLHTLRSFVGYVPQSISLISGTIRENLQFSNKDADDNLLIQALKMAQAEELIEGKVEGSVVVLRTEFLKKK